MKKCIIKRIADKIGCNQASRHIAQITGVSSIPKPGYYRNTETGDEYLHLVGGIAYPGDGKPGFVIVIAVNKPSNEEDKPVYTVLDEFESKSIRDLIFACVELRERYGYLISENLFHYWYGDPERLYSIINKINQEMFYKDQPGGVYISPPYDFEKPNNFEIYFQAILSCLSGEKTLFLGSCDKIRNHLVNIPEDASSKGKLEDHPAVSALGFVLHTMTIARPWEVPTPLDSDTLLTIEEAEAFDYERW